MTHTIVFNLPDEQAELDDAIQGGKAKSILWELDQKMRGILKYEEHSEEVEKIVQDLRNELNDMCIEMNVVIE